jgi:endoglucanase
MDLLKQLTETPGVPGREERVRKLVESQAAGLFDEITTDAMGNLLCRRKPTSKTRKAGRKIMLACHIDEIGFYVKYIDDKGFLRLHNAGGFDTRNLFARRVLVQGRKDIVGVLNPAGKPVHLADEEERKKVPKMHEFFVDLFLDSKQVAKLVRVGDPVTLIQTTEVIGDATTGKCMDNRVASYVALEAVRRLAGGKAGCANDIYYVATVQEEVGCRGAGPATFGIDPDVAIAIDTTLACDTPGIPADQAVCTFGGGVAIKIMDSYSISSRELVDEFVALAGRKKIKHQLEVLPLGGTDAGPMQRTREGYKTITLSVPCRYVHTVCESVHRGDLQATVDLLAAYLAQ